MIQFYTGDELSPFIHLDDYCREVFKNYKHDPELEVVLVFGKNEREAGKSLNKNDLDFFKEFHNITIIYCKDLHAKFYSNEKEGLLTSLNLLDKCMVKNIEYGIYFTNSFNPIEKLYEETVGYTNEVIKTNPCVYVKRPNFKKELFGLKKSFLSSEVLWDITEELYQNRRFVEKFYSDFKGELTFSKETKPNRSEFKNSSNNYSELPKKSYKNEGFNDIEFGFCIRTGRKIPFDISRPLSYSAYQTWAMFKDYNFQENYCHKTGRESNGRTSMANPIL